MKTCTKCGKTKPLEDFSANGRRRHRADCKQCCAAQARAYYAANPEKYRAKNGLWWAANPGARRRHWLRKYGLGTAEYDRLLLDQDGRCAICCEPPDSGQILAVDHDHRTGKIRGLLCGRCNKGIGLMKDDPFRLRAAIAYLQAAGFAESPVSAEKPMSNEREN